MAKGKGKKPAGGVLPVKQHDNHRARRASVFQQWRAMRRGTKTEFRKLVALGRSLREDEVISQRVALRLVGAGC